MIVPGADALRGATGAEIDSGERVAHLARLVATPVLVPEAELAGAIFSPALERVVVEYRAGVTAADGDRFDGSARADVDGWKIVAHRSGSVAVWAGAPESEPTEDPGSPALHARVAA